MFIVSGFQASFYIILFFPLSESLEQVKELINGK